MAWPDVQKDLIAILIAGITVSDDLAVALTGVISGAWYDRSLFTTNDYQITVGPSIVPDARIADIGAFHKHYDSIHEVDVWVLEKRNVNYTAQRVKTELIHRIDTLLWNIEAGTTYPDLFIDVVRWNPNLDEPDKELLRARVIVAIFYGKER